MTEPTGLRGRGGVRLASRPSDESSGREATYLERAALECGG
ncbi:MAG: hypothetical protein QXK96_01940 [Candidatus Bathyarchaeia archaeon]